MNHRLMPYPFEGSLSACAVFVVKPFVFVHFSVPSAREELDPPDVISHHACLLKTLLVVGDDMLSHENVGLMKGMRTNDMRIVTNAFLVVSLDRAFHVHLALRISRSAK